MNELYRQVKTVEVKLHKCLRVACRLAGADPFLVVFGHCVFFLLMRVMCSLS